MSKVGFKMIHGHNYATWELKIVKFSNFRQNHFSDFETPFSVGLMLANWLKSFALDALHVQTTNNLLKCFHACIFLRSWFTIIRKRRKSKNVDGWWIFEPNYNILFLFAIVVVFWNQLNTCRKYVSC